MTAENFSQLCVMEGTVLGDSSIQDFENHFLQELDVRIKYCTEVTTLPDKDKFGNDVPETGGRNDLFFYVHSEDVSKFAIPRFQYGIRWWEDIFYNKGENIYPEEFLAAHKPTW